MSTTKGFLSAGFNGTALISKQYHVRPASGAAKRDKSSISISDFTTPDALPPCALTFDIEATTGCDAYASVETTISDGTWRSFDFE